MSLCTGNVPHYWQLANLTAAEFWNLHKIQKITIELIQ